MPQQQPQANLAFFDSSNNGQEFTVTLRGYDRAQVDTEIARLSNALHQSEQTRAEAEQRLSEIQRRARQTERDHRSHGIQVRRMVQNDDRHAVAAGFGPHFDACAAIEQAGITDGGLQSGQPHAFFRP